MGMSVSEENMQSNTLNLLRIDSSSQMDNSVSRMLGDRLISHFKSQAAISQTSRDLAQGVEYINSDWVDATFTLENERNENQRQVLLYSDNLLEELMAAEVIVITVPIYNFAVPAVLKAWIDQISRAGVTFKYTESGPVGLLENKKVYIVIVSGGVPFASTMDFASPFLKQFLAFIGIEDVNFVTAMQLNNDRQGAIDVAEQQIVKININDFL